MMRKSIDAVLIWGRMLVGERGSFVDCWISMLTLEVALSLRMFHLRTFEVFKLYNNYLSKMMNSNTLFQKGNYLKIINLKFEREY